ncbi:MAG: hypothetical protein KAR42_16945 [candidate division Zixibacteria bacterium]|nr:hypothetical protein [candidate division Zixibacteria bacterium]
MKRKNKIIEPCKEIHFREIYEIDNVMATYYPWEQLRIMTFFMLTKKAFILLIVAMRLLLRIEPKLD